MSITDIEKVLTIGSREITFEPIAHTYTDKEGNQYLPVSDLIDRYKVPFNKDFMAKQCANKRMRETGIPTTSEDILKEWDRAGLESRVWGTSVHAAIEQYIRTGDFDHPEKEKLFDHLSNEVLFILDILKGEDVIIIPECILFSYDHYVCGTSDIVMYNPDTKKIYIWDLKTNDHIKTIAGYYEKNPPFNFKPTRQKMKGFLSHLEDCNFNHYQLQLSIYAYLIEMLGFDIGTLQLIHYPWKPGKNNDGTVTMIMCNYLKDEVEMIMQARKAELCI
jgi:hypothetical protein